VTPTLVGPPLSFGSFVYAEIIAAACAKLRDDRFACFLVGDVRDKAGLYYGFPAHTQAAFEAAGLRLYNEAILVTAAGSLPIRAGKQFLGVAQAGQDAPERPRVRQGRPAQGDRGRRRG
jgi:hypothetical protein